MKPCVDRSSTAALAVAGLLLGMSFVPGRVQAGSYQTGQNGAPNQYGMSPNMRPDGPMAPENNVAFTQQHTSDAIRENMAMEINLSNLALKRSRDHRIHRFALEVIKENLLLDNDAKQFAPDKTGTFPNPALEGTRQAVEGHAAEKQMKTLTGPQFDRMYLVQMNKYAENDQQVGHSAYAMMEFPGISPVGRKMWDSANGRVKRIAALAGQLNIKLQ